MNTQYLFNIFAFMALQLYNPFDNLYFDDKTCFLTGVDLKNSEETITVFPEWVMKQYNLENSSFTMMDNITSIAYKNLKLPCSENVKAAFLQLDDEIRNAFNGGYESVKALDTQKLFLWMGKMVYGVLYNDLLIEKKRLEQRKLELQLSARLKERMSLFHLMLQSLVAPITFGELKPWSISVVKLKYSKDIFNYHDDTIKLLFSLGMNGFGIIACLQDNGVVTHEQKDILDKIGETVLHPIQFEELYARFLYATFLLQYKVNYKIEQNENKLYIEALPITAERNKLLFGARNNNMYAQVLADLWSPWGLKKKDILNFPDEPVSFLEDATTYELIDPEKIEFPF